MDIGSRFFFTQRPFLTSVVFLTLQDIADHTWTTRFHCFFFVFFFAMVSNAVDTL